MRVVLALAVVVVGAALLVRDRPWDSRLSAERAASALATRVGGSARFACERVENDGTIEGLDDVDYFCQRVDRPDESGYWIATDRERITGLQPAG